MAKVSVSNFLRYDCFDSATSGTFNRVYQLTMDTGVEVLAKLPFPNAGPRRLSTASEVATMEFLRSRFALPIPKVLAWNASSTNPVGWEYIVMEKCYGSMFGQHVDDVSHSPNVVSSLARMQRDIASVRFSRFGSLYFKEDVDEQLQALPLYAPGVPEDDYSQRFRIGPTVDRQFYRGNRVGMDIDRGPCKSAAPFPIWSRYTDYFLLVGLNARSYVEAFAKCEIEWIRKNGLSPAAQNQTGARHTPDAHIASLQKWLTLVPMILPHALLCEPFLSHPDMSGANILVAGEKRDMVVSGIIDWQGASIRPMFDFSPPRFLMTESDKIREIGTHSDRGNDTLPASLPTAPSGQELVVINYIKNILELSPPLYEVLSSTHLEKVRSGMYYSSHSWSDGLPPLNVALGSICDSYGDDIPSHPDYPTCPVSYTDEERQQLLVDLKFHSQEALLENYARRWLAKYGIDWQEDGCVLADRFEEAQDAINELYAIAVKPLSQEQHRVDALNRAWPYRTNKFTLTAEVCI